LSSEALAAVVTTVTSSTASNLVETTSDYSEDFDVPCVDCTKKYPDPAPERLVMWLHAYNYEFGKYRFEGKFPSWANEEFQGDAVINRYWLNKSA
jgi:hypothetical protein